MPDKKPPIVPCPHCGKELHWDVTNRYRPFCSERCKLIDLGKWRTKIIASNRRAGTIRPDHQA